MSKPGFARSGGDGLPPLMRQAPRATVWIAGARGFLRIGGETMTDLKRLAIAVPPELENAIYDMRAKDEFRRLSISEIVRRLIEAGLAAYAEKRGA